MNNIVTVDLGDRSYEIRLTAQTRFEEFLAAFRADLRRTWAGRSCRKVMVVTDRMVEPLARVFADALASADFETRLIAVEPGEGSKSREGLNCLHDALIDFRADRHTTVLAAGGGVVGDLAGFAAATYARGLPLFMIPTSLLAQVDSAVGGKVAINHPKAKNILGAFHQPIGVWIDLSHLRSLPPRQLRCGLAEVVKHGVILDPDLFEFVERHVADLLALEPHALTRVVADSCRLKAGVVTRDEREETGLRAILNFGHTVGHAVEAVAGYGGDLPHGEAVAIGMVAEAELARRLGWVGPDLPARVAALCVALGLPIRAPGLSLDLVRTAMTLDKKNQAGRVRFVLPRRLGLVEVTDEVSDDLLNSVLEEVVRP